jgi:hypothetical protein
MKAIPAILAVLGLILTAAIGAALGGGLILALNGYQGIDLTLLFIVYIFCFMVACIVAVIWSYQWSKPRIRWRTHPVWRTILKWVVLVLFLPTVFFGGLVLLLVFVADMLYWY